ncbi:unnamed protein product [Phytomonas sp. EM1]|nr:unnamed protein product [Phytomonas sp. EM1]|eukprot:CCW61635.1 unnamed protein product [Phytomonas sp. isolate EM1]
MNYTFEWQDLGDSGSTFSPFRCLTPSGHLHAERQVEMGFEFCADELGVREARWAFNLIGQASIPFLLAGKAVDPEVFLSTSKVNFGVVIVGSSATQTVMLENRDHLPFNFAFDILEESEVLNVLSVKPTSGVVEPMEKVAICVTFSPNEEMVYNIPLVCNIKKSSTSLSINVKGEGVYIHDSLMVEIPEIGRMAGSMISPDVGNADPMPVTRGEPLHLNLGRVQLDTCAIRRFVLSNNGHHPFNFKVLAPPNYPSVSLENCEGVVPAKESTAITLTYRPTAEETLQRYKMRFRIADRPAYQVILHGTGYVPKIHLSFTSYNFGPRFITMYNPNHEVTTTLNVSNTDREPISVQLVFFEDSEKIFQVEPSFLALQPNEMASVTVSFNPKEVRVYENRLKLTVNGAFPTVVSFRGEGEIPHVDVVNHFAKLGVARVGGKRQVEVRLECRSRLATPVSFDNCIDEDLIEKGISISTDAAPLNTLPSSLGSTVHEGGEKAAAAALAPRPSTMLLLKPRETKTVTITFQPLRRMGEFQRKLRMQVCGREALFAVISGACEGSEIHIDTSHLRFDDVVVGSSATRRLIIMNSGDIAQKFTWRGLHRGESELSVHPMSGFLRAHTEVVCLLTYSPQRAESVLQRSCEIAFEDAPPLEVVVSGNAVGRPAAKDVLSFACRARETCTREVSFENPLGKPWALEPVIDNALWCAPRQVVVKPFATLALPVTYAPIKPTTTTAEESGGGGGGGPNGKVGALGGGGGGVDLGTLFLPLPDGAGLSYVLEGRAEAAGPVGPPLHVEVEAKTPQSLSLKVENWAPTPLRFVREVSWFPELEEGVISLGEATPSGSSTTTLEVRAQSSKEAVITLTCMREGFYRGTIAFNCPEKPEMRQYYEVELRVLPPSLKSVITTELYAAAQTAAVHHLPLSNPLGKAVLFTSRVELATSSAGGNPALVDFFTAPSSMVVPAKSAVNFPVKFVPLFCKPYPSVRLILSSEELGVSQYLFKLTAGPQSAEPVTRLVCPLGQSVTFVLRFTFLGRTSTEFAISVSGSKLGGSTASAQGAVFTKLTPGGGTFKVTPAAGAQWPKGQDVAVEFSYEPQSIGTLTETIVFSSPVGGVFTFPVVGTCTPPQRQGPVLLKPDSTTSISFKNVFPHFITIGIITDPSQHFVVNKKSDTIAPKKTTNLVVQCKMEDSMDTCYGKLIISCTPAGSTEPIEWVYYLEAKRADGVNLNRRSLVVRKK